MAMPVTAMSTILSAAPVPRPRGLSCKFPDLKFSCMSAYCVFAKKLADVCDMEYDCGDGLLTLFGMYVFD